jgi:hypothetical protein
LEKNLWGVGVVILSYDMIHVFRHYLKIESMYSLTSSPKNSNDAEAEAEAEAEAPLLLAPALTDDADAEAEAPLLLAEVTLLSFFFSFFFSFLIFFTGGGGGGMVRAGAGGGGGGMVRTGGGGGGGMVRTRSSHTQIGSRVAAVAMIACKA